MDELPMGDPLAYFMTWATYGTWLPGDERGWVEYQRGRQPADPVRLALARTRMTEQPCWLSQVQRAIVEEAIRECCSLHEWMLHVVNCRSNHAHLVVSAPINPKQVRSKLKAYCTLKLKKAEAASMPDKSPQTIRKNWWAERGSIRFLNDEDSLERAILYVRDAQDHHTNPKRSEDNKH